VTSVDEAPVAERPAAPPPKRREHLGLRDALSLLRAGAEQAEPSRTYRVGIACSFTPLHLETFALAYITRKRPGMTISAVSGIYGDLPGTVDQLAQAGVDSCVALVEWFDLDPRLGCRDAVGAPVAEIDDILSTARLRLERIASRLQALGRQCPTALALPSLDLPAVYEGNRSRVGSFRASLNLMLAEFAAAVIEVPGLRVVAPEAVASDLSAPGAPRDLRSDIRSGFPYSVAHASALAQAAVEVLLPAPTKKGLITDLDDTLWRGLAGEIGPDAVTWDLDSGSLAHALYQQLLAGLSRRGVLLAVASKNDPEVVDKALGRADLLVSADMIYPVAASWGPKSRAVGEILRAWNIAASDVVFVDDSLTELAEVEAKYPEITTVPFPTGDANAIAATLSELAGLFWREHVTAEDSLRLSSLRSAAELEQAVTSAEDELAFLRDLDGRITIRSGRSWEQPRALELVNKTNQFNLNGRRFDEVQWRELCNRPGSIVWTISYEDRFGQLGVISVLAGLRTQRTITVDCWVLSCRAFSRAIEHHVLRSLCQVYNAARIDLDFMPTERNDVLRALLDRIAPAHDRGRPQLDCRAMGDDELADIHVIHQDSDDG
jgi:FkbH-like protein